MSALSPKSQTSTIILTSTGAAGDVAAAVPYGVYTGSTDFLSGASLQVNHVFKKLGGDVVDIELTPSNVYAAYEEAVLEYSYIVNLHQSKNVLSDALGNSTGTFDHLGNIKGDAALSSSLAGDHVALKYPRAKLQAVEINSLGMHFFETFVETAAARDLGDLPGGDISK